MNSNRICFISPSAYGYFSPETGFTGGGAQRQLYEISTRLQDRFDVHFVVGDYGQEPMITVDGVTLQRAHDPRVHSTIGDHIKQPDRTLRKVLKLLHALRRADADIYIYRGDPGTAAVIYALVACLRKRWVYHVANDHYVYEEVTRLPLPLERLFRRGLRKASLIVAQNSHQSDELMRRYGLNSTVIPNGYPTSDESVPYVEREGFLWVGRLERQQKQPHIYLDLAEEIPDEEFILIGPSGPDDSYQNQMLARTEELSNVEYLGSVNPRKIQNFYRKRYALVNTSSYEGFPNTFLEAWRVGTPVLSYKIDPSALTPGIVLGSYADGDLSKLVRLGRALATETSMRRKHGIRAKAEFDRRFQISDIVRRYGDALTAII